MSGYYHRILLRLLNCIYVELEICILSICIALSHRPGGKDKRNTDKVPIERVIMCGILFSSTSANV